MIKLFTLNPDPSKVITPRAGARRLAINIGGTIASWPSLDATPQYAGAIEVASYETEDTMLAALGYRTLAELKAAARGVRWWARENVVLDSPLPPSDKVVKMTCLVTRKPGMPRREFLSYYPSIHAPMVRKTPELARYIQNYIQSDTEDGYDLEYDGVAELWWTDRDTAQRSWDTDEMLVEQIADTQKFLAPRTTLVIGREKYIA